MNHGHQRIFRQAASSLQTIKHGMMTQVWLNSNAQLHRIEGLCRSASTSCNYACLKRVGCLPENSLHLEVQRRHHGGQRLWPEKIMGFRGEFAVTSLFGFRFVRRLFAQNMSTSDWLALKRLESLKPSVTLDSELPVGKVKMLISKKNYDALMYAINLQSQLDKAMMADMKESVSVENLIPKASSYMAIMYAIEYGGPMMGLALQPSLKDVVDFAVERITGGFEIGSAIQEAKLTIHVTQAKSLSQRVLTHAQASVATAASASASSN